MKDGVVVLDNTNALSEGMRVLVCAFNFECADLPKDNEGCTLLERLAPVVGVAKGLPFDASVNLDHYLYSSDNK